MTDEPTPIPPYGTPERQWYIAGATAESRSQVEGMTKDGRQFYDCAQILAQQGNDPERLLLFLGPVFGCVLPFRSRLRLAWVVLWSARRARTRRRVRVYLEPRDWWIGYYRGDDHHYVCPLPCVVIRWKRRRP